MVERKDPSLIRGAPGHGGLSKIVSQNILRSAGEHEDNSDELNRKFKLLINTEAFLALAAPAIWHGTGTRIVKAQN